MTLPQSVKKHDAGKIPGPAAVPAVVEIKCVGILPNAKQWTMTFHGAYTTPPANINTLAGSLFTSITGAWTTNLAALMSTGTQFTSVQCRDMASVTNPIGVGTGAAALGTSASPAMPENAAIVLTENIASRGRGAKGRAYLGGWATNADGGGGVITSAAQTAINGFGTSLFSAISAQSLTPCVAQVARAAYLGITGTSHVARAASHVNVTNYQCRDVIWDTQRRRIQQ